jgi:hypothetical protein
VNQRSGGGTRGYPVEDFLQALTSQLDNAQDVLAVKVRAGRPLTWALKDLTLDLKVFMEVDPSSGKVLIRSAGPTETGASTLHVNLTTITRAMVEENTRSFQADADPRPIGDLKAAAELDDHDERRLEWMGIRTVGQLRQLSRDSSPKAVESMLGIPALRLRAALEAAARPTVTHVETVRRPDGRRLLRVMGANLDEGGSPEVKLSGEAVEVLNSAPNELLVCPMDHHNEGGVEVFAGGQRAAGFYRMPKENGASASAAKATGVTNGGDA